MAAIENYPVGQKYESIFGIFMLALAYLWRDNPHMAYPQILHLLGLFFVLNFAAGLSLRFWPNFEALTGAIVLANCAVTTAILHYSGGIASNLWILYLLPIYTACMLLPTRYAVWITAGAGAFNVMMYTVSKTDWAAADVSGLALKTGILVFASAVTHNLVEKERAARERIAHQREEVLRLEALTAEEDSTADDQLTHDLLTPIMIIHGTIQIMQEDTEFSHRDHPDIARIDRAATRCRDLIFEARQAAKAGENITPAPPNQTTN